MKTVEWSRDSQNRSIEAFLNRPAFDPAAEEAARKVLDDVKREGDAAVSRYVAQFDGATLNGWVQRGGKALYKVESGSIVGTCVRGTPNSFLCTKRTYANFILELEFKVNSKLNSGVQIRSSSIPQYSKGRVHGYQVEIA